MVELSDLTVNSRTAQLNLTCSGQYHETVHRKFNVQLPESDTLNKPETADHFQLIRIT